MSYLLISSDPGASLLADGWRIPADQVPALRSALDVLAQACQRLDAVERLAEEARAEARAAGQAEGREQALATGAAATAVRLAELSAADRVLRDALRDQVGQLALEVVRRIAGRLASEAVVQQLAEQAVHELLPDQPIVVRVAPAAAGATAQRLWALNAAIEVVSDDALGPLDCVLEGPGGRAEASLETQLAALEAAFAEAALARPQIPQPANDLDDVA